MEPEASCYCCPKSTPTNLNSSAMNLDSALNELGMLSTVTDSRKQFLKEEDLKVRRALLVPQRGRNLSEPGLSGAGTPSNSPSKGVYQIVQLNQQFVTSLSTGLSACTSQMRRSAPSSPSSLLKPDPANSAVRECLDFGERYKQEELEQDARANRLSRLKISRVKRFRRPYDLPWRQTLERAYNTLSPPVTTSLLYNINQGQYSSQPSTPFICVSSEKPRKVEQLCSSNASTPEKVSKSCRLTGQESTVTRSKSLDDLDISKLQLAESENHNFLQERKDIDTVSDHFQGLHVQE